MNLLCPNKCAYKMTPLFFWYDHICKLRNNLTNAHTHYICCWKRGIIFLNHNFCRYSCIHIMVSTSKVCSDASVWFYLVFGRPCSPLNMVRFDKFSVWHHELRNLYSCVSLFISSFQSTNLGHSPASFSVWDHELTQH